MRHLTFNDSVMCHISCRTGCWAGGGLIINSESPLSGKTVSLKTPGICEN